jgi:HrpA-like RNA helicase
LKSLAAGGWTGSALVFLPGAGEIRGAADAVSAWGREAGFGVFELHGSLPLSAQQEALRAPGNRAAVILATNVAETSLTVPGVTAVIDSGMHRVAAYDPDRDLNTLYLRGISRANAVQRAGRAGRVAPGICIRLWDSGRDAGMAPALEPELRRTELSEASLALHALVPGGRAAWPTPPDPALWTRALAKLERIEALRNGALTPLGKSLLAWPAPPELARVLHDAARNPDPDLRRQVAAMAAVLSSGKRARGAPGDLFALGQELAEENPRQADRETLEAFRQFLRKISGSSKSKPFEATKETAAEALKEKAARLFLRTRPWRPAWGPEGCTRCQSRPPFTFHSSHWPNSRPMKWSFLPGWA